MRKFKISIFLVTILLFLFGCVHTAKNQGVENNRGNSGFIKTYHFESIDEEMSFKLYNIANLSKEELESIESKTLEAYDFILASINSGFERASEISIYLKEGFEKSTTGNKTTIHLHRSYGNDYPLVHELTHSLLGVGKSFDYTYGYLTQEGLAEYFQYEIGEVYDFNYGIPAHKKMNYLLERNKNIPLFKLVDLEIANDIFISKIYTDQSNTLNWIGYVQVGSFVTYLIDTYGFEKFEAIYNHPELEKQIEAIYNKTLEDLEKEWIEYVTFNIEPLSKDELSSQVMRFYIRNLDLIDPAFFES